MKVVTININGQSYPCGPSMGAMLRFKKTTGKEYTEIDPSSLEDQCVFVWCCVVSACRREKIPFDYSFEDFADNMSMDDLYAFNAAVQQAQEELTEVTPAAHDGQGQKKRTRG